MIFRPYDDYDRGCAAYVFGCGTLGKGAVVDARADDIDAYIEFADAKGLRLTHVIDTHVHADHRSGGPELARRVGAQYCIHEAADVTYPFTALHDGAGLSGKPMTTVGFEKRWNPMLTLERDAFVEKLADVPPKPADMERVLAFNRRHETATMP